MKLSLIHNNVLQEYMLWFNYYNYYSDNDMDGSLDADL